MHFNPVGRFLAGIALGTTVGLAGPVFQGGVASFVFEVGDGTSFSETANPIPLGFGLQLNVANPGPGLPNPGPLYATGTAGMWHQEDPGNFSLSLPSGTGVSQMDLSNDPHDPSTVTISFSATWQMNGEFGPPAFGYANFPEIAGVVGAGAGSYVKFELDASWSGGATRPPVNFTYLNAAPGPFSTAFLSTVLMTPASIGDNEFETISGTIKFTARGVEDMSIIRLEQDSGAMPAPVPEPEAWAMVGGAGLLVFGFCRYRRRTQMSSADAISS